MPTTSAARTEGTAQAQAKRALVARRNRSGIWGAVAFEARNRSETSFGKTYPPGAEWQGVDAPFPGLRAPVPLTVEISADLANCTALATRAGDGTWTGAITDVPTAPGKVQVTLTNPTTVPGRFYRLRVELLP